MTNKGIGLAIVRGLCRQLEGDVFLTSRDEGRGREAVAALERERGSLPNITSWTSQTRPPSEG